MKNKVVIVLFLCISVSWVQAQNIIRENNDFFLVDESGHQDFLFQHTSSKSLEILDFLVIDYHNVSIALLEKNIDLSESICWIIICKKNEQDIWEYDWTTFEAKRLGNYSSISEIKKCLEFSSQYKIASRCFTSLDKIDLLNLNGSRLKGTFRRK